MRDNNSQLQLSVLATVPVRISRLSSVALRPGHVRHRGLDRHLHLGPMVESAPTAAAPRRASILAHVAMGEHIVAELLGVAQPGAVAEHDHA